MSQGTLSRRRFLQLSTITAVGTALAACAASSSGAGTGTGIEAAAASTTVSFMSTGGETEQLMFQEALEVANQQPALQDRNIVIEWQPDPGGGWDKIMAMFASDTAYDVQRIDDDRVAALALNNKIHQLDCLMEVHEINVDDYYPYFWQTINLGGYQFSMNPAGGTNAVYYNIDLFEQAGLDLPPTSWADAWEWEEFLAISEQLSIKDANNRPTQYAMGFPSNVVGPIAYGAGGSYLSKDQTACTMADPAVISAVAAFGEHTAPGGPEFFVPPGVDAAELFNSGMLAMYWASSNFAPTISQDIRWEIAPWMKTPLAAHTENFDRTFVIPKSAPDHEAAFLVLKTLCEQPAVDVFARGGFGVPYFIASAEGAYAERETPVNKQVWLETFQVINDVRIDIPTPRGPSIKQTFTDAAGFEAVMAGQQTAEEFLVSGCAKADQELAGWEWRAGIMEERLLEAGVISCEGTKMWPETDWA